MLYFSSVGSSAVNFFRISVFSSIFVEPTCSEQDIGVTIFIWCMCICVHMCACVCGVDACVPPSGFVWAITSTFMHGFQNDLAQLFSMRRRSAI